MDFNEDKVILVGPCALVLGCYQISRVCDTLLRHQETG